MGRTSTSRDRLIESMADLVHKKGYTAVGVDQVCKAAGVKKGSFYYFFKSKRDLMLAALDQRWDLVSAHVLDRAFARDVPPLVRIERLFAIVADFEIANHRSFGSVLGCAFGNVAAEVGTTEPVIAKRVDDAFCGMAGFIRDAIREAQAAGDVDPAVDPDEIADAAVAYFEGVVLLAKTRNDPALLRRLAPRVVQLAGVPAPAGNKPRRSNYDDRQ